MWVVQLGVFAVFPASSLTQVKELQSGGEVTAKLKPGVSAAVPIDQAIAIWKVRRLKVVILLTAVRE